MPTLSEWIYHFENDLDGFERSELRKSFERLQKDKWMVRHYAVDILNLEYCLDTAENNVMRKAKGK